MANNPQIVIFQEDEKALNYRYKLDYPTGPNILVKSLEHDYEEFKEKNKIISNNRVNDKTVYFLHPYKDNVYVDESIGENYFLEEKLELYKRAASLLGAKSISTKVSLMERQSITTDANGEVNYNAIKLEAGSKSKIENNYKNSLEIFEEFETQDNFNKERNIDDLYKFIETNNLDHELGLVTLIERRDSRQSGTLLTKRTVKSEITSEYNNLLEVSAKLNSPVFSVSGGYKRKLQEVNTLMVDIEFIF
jgi:hypothetical protein